MWQYVVKVILSAIVVVAVSELAKRTSFWAAALASLPLTSLLAFVWLYLEGGSVEQIAELSGKIFWLVLPSLVLFIVLPVLLRIGVGFWFSLGASCLATAGAYTVMLWTLSRLAIRI
jgi:hypothetical protein